MAGAPPLIIGGGPTGLAAALFLRRAGIESRVIEAATQREPHSRALAVNPRTLALLEPSGITEKILSIGIKLVGMQLRQDGEVVVELDLDKVLDDPRPYMIALSQAVSERLLKEALLTAGGTVETGRKLVSCRVEDGAVVAEIEGADGAPNEVVRAPWLLGADGAHTAVRHSLGIPMDGSVLETPWNLADVPAKLPLPEDRAHILFFKDGGFLFVIRVVDDQWQGDMPLWRVMGNFEKPLEHLPPGSEVGEPVWQSSFHIAHRVARQFSSGPIYLAGDAAHLHSPVGARGMNLGIEDAYVFSQLAAKGELDRYADLRHTADSAVVRRIKLITEMAIGENVMTRTLRTRVVPKLARLSFIRKRMMHVVTGLDHEILL